MLKMIRWYWKVGMNVGLSSAMTLWNITLILIITSLVDLMFSGASLILWI
jgi:hypothetical protein